MSLIELLAEVALQQTFEGLSMPGFIDLPPIKIFATDKKISTVS